MYEVMQTGNSNYTQNLLRFIVALNLVYCAVEAAVAWRIGSVSLFADASDFLEDATLSLLVLWALGKPLRLQAIIAFGLAAIVAAPGLVALGMAYGKWLSPAVPNATALTITGAGAFAVNALCAFLLAGMRSRGGSLLRAAYLSARNDVIGNVAIIGAGFATAYWSSAWPDVAVGLALFALHSGAGIEVFSAARAELKEQPQR